MSQLRDDSDEARLERQALSGLPERGGGGSSFLGFAVGLPPANLIGRPVRFSLQAGV